MDTGKKFIKVEQKDIIKDAVVKDLMPHVVFKETVEKIEYDGSVDGQPLARLASRVDKIEKLDGTHLDLVIDPKTYQLQALLFNASGDIVSKSAIIDLPIEEMVVNVTYDERTQSIILELKSGTKTIVPISGIITGLATQDWVNAGFTTKTEHNALRAKVLYYEVVNI